LVGGLSDCKSDPEAVARPGADPQALRPSRHDRCRTGPRHGLFHARHSEAGWPLRAGRRCGHESADDRTSEAPRRQSRSLDRIDARTVRAESMQLADLDADVDFVFAFAVVHELPSAPSFFLETAGMMKSGADMLLAEPAGHDGEAEFAEQIEAAAHHGLSVLDRPPINRCVAALLRKS